MKTSSLILVLVLLIALPASAQYATVIQACSQDVTTVCPDSQSGQNRFGECVELHFPDLSERCQASLVRIATVLKACANRHSRAMPLDQARGGSRVPLRQAAFSRAKRAMQGCNGKSS